MVHFCEKPPPLLWCFPKFLCCKNFLKQTLCLQVHLAQFLQRHLPLLPGLLPEAWRPLRQPSIPGTIGVSCADVSCEGQILGRNFMAVASARTSPPPLWVILRDGGPRAVCVSGAYKCWWFPNETSGGKTEALSLFRCNSENVFHKHYNATWSSFWVSDACEINAQVPLGSPYYQQKEVGISQCWFIPP